MPEITDNQATATEKPAAATPARREGFFESIYADIIGIGLTVGAGLAAARIIINKSFFGNLAEDRKKKKDDVLRSIVDRDRERIAAAHNKDWPQAIEAIEKKYQKNIKEELSEMGVNSILDKWKSLRGHQKWEAGIAMAAVSAVAIGSISSFLSNRRLDHKLEEIHQQVMSQQQEIPSRH